MYESYHLTTISFFGSLSIVLWSWVLLMPLFSEYLKSFLFCVWNFFQHMLCEHGTGRCLLSWPRRWCKFITFFCATGSCIISSCSLLQISWRPSYCCCGCSTSVRWQLSGKFFLYESFNFLRLSGFVAVIYTGWDLSLL